MHFALAVPLTPLDVVPPLVSVGVMWWQMYWRRRAHLGIQVEAGNDLMAVHSHTHPTDLLLRNRNPCLVKLKTII